MAEPLPDADVDRLYGLPLDEFVVQRDALAKKLRGDGDKDAAAAAKALRKPTAGAWALNQAVRRRRAETDALLKAGERLRAAHAGLLAGGDRDELRAAMSEQRELTATLADCAEAIASETGKSGPALKERVRGTLHAAALDDDVREELARGRLVREREAVGLGSAFSAPDGPPAGGGAGPRKPSKRESKRSADRAEAERLLDEAEAARDQAEQAAEEASARVEAARAALTQAEREEREAARLVREREKERAKRERALRRLQD